MGAEENVNKIESQVGALVDAICRRSPMMADWLGLSLTGEELERIYTMVGIRFFIEKVTDGDRPTVGDILKFAYGKQDE